MKNIQPVDEAAVRQAVDEQAAAAPTRPVDVSKIYNTGVQPANQNPHAAAPDPGKPQSPPPKYNGPKPRVSFRESDLKLYSLVLLILGVISLGYFLYQVFSLRSLYGYHLGLHLNYQTIVGLLALVMPIAGSLYLLLTRSVIGARAVMIVIGISYGLSIINQIDFFINYHALIRMSPSLIGSFLLNIGLLGWTFTTYGSVSALDE